MPQSNGNWFSRIRTLLSDPDAILQSRFFSKLRSAWNIFYEFCTAEKARRLADASDTPEVTFGKMGSLVVRSIPFMFPMWPHILFMFVLGWGLAFFNTFADTVMDDMWNNKHLIGDKLQPGQAWLFMLDDSYVRSDLLESSDATDLDETAEANEESVEEEDNEEVEKLTIDQRRKVRNHMYFGYAFRGLFGLLQGVTLGYYFTWIWQNVNHYLRVAMIERLEYLSMSFHHSNRSGDAIFRVYQDSAMIVNVLDEVVIGPMEIARGLFISVWFVCIFDAMLLIAVAIVWVPGILLTLWYTPRIRRRSVANRVANSNLTSTVQEVFRAAKIVKANRTENVMLNRFKRDSKTALDAAFYLRFDMVMLNLMVGFLSGLMIIATEYIMAMWVLDSRPTMLPAWAVSWVSFSIWNYGAFNAARERIGESINTSRGVIRLWCMIQDLFIALERAFYFLELKPGVEESSVTKAYPLPVKSVEWQNVTFAYPDGDQVLSGVNLRAEVGTVTAVVGSTGSGKSTLMTLLLRLYDPQAGRVLVNDTDVRELTLQDMRQNTAIALQKNVLFTGKIRDNIAYAVNDVSDEAIHEAARVACADRFIEKMDLGYESELGERGGKLSAGERQRLSIARAILRDTPILVLDEPTASLDAETENQVLKNLAEWGRDRIVFIVTHRLSTVRNADQIAFLSDGKIAEVGSHDELMRIGGGHYREYVEAELEASQPQRGARS